MILFWPSTSCWAEKNRFSIEDDLSMDRWFFSCCRVRSDLKKLTVNAIRTAERMQMKTMRNNSHENGTGLATHFDVVLEWLLQVDEGVNVDDAVVGAVAHVNVQLLVEQQHENTCGLSGSAWRRHFWSVEHCLSLRMIPNCRIKISPA